MTKFSDSWVLFADCDVIYDGRASSILQRGNYLIIRKPDHSLSIHGSTLIQPRNYLAGGSVVYNENVLEFVYKKEKIIIRIYNIISIVELTNWSDHKISITKTERELALKIVNNWDTYFNNSNVEYIYQEYQTSLGPIDIFGKSTDADYVIEVKRKTCSIKDVTQLLRYVEAIETPNRIIKGYLASPSINKNALKYLTKHGMNHLQIDF